MKNIILIVLTLITVLANAQLSTVQYNKNVLNAKICDHRFDADISLDINSDIFQAVGTLKGEAALFKSGLRGTLFYHSVNDYSDKTSLMPSAHYPARYVKALDGDPQNQWNEALRDHEKFTLNLSDRLVTTIAYSEGDTSFVDSNLIVNSYLFGRNSDDGDKLDIPNCPTFYGRSWTGEILGEIGQFSSTWNRRYVSNRPASSRWGNTGTNWSTPAALDYASDTDSIVSLLDHTITDKGFLSNFTHWQFNDDCAAFMYFLDSLRSAIDEKSIVLANNGHQSILEYATMREMAIDQNILKSEYVGDSTSARVYIEIDTSSWPFYLFQDRVVSISLDLEGTELEGVDISCKSCLSVIKKETDIFILDVQLEIGQYRKGILIQEGVQEYYDTSIQIPAIVMNIDGSDVTIDCDNCTVVLYESTTGNPEGITNTKLYRSIAKSDVHNFTIGIETYFVGIKDDKGVGLFLVN